MSYGAPAPAVNTPDADAVAGVQTSLLFAALYDDLRRLARREVRRNGARDFMGTSTVVHEAWLDISQRPSLEFDHPGRFLAYAARTMRGLVIDRVRARQAQKRGGDLSITALDTESCEQAAPDLPDLDRLEHISEALEGLAKLQPDLAEVVDLKFFCGFTLAEVGRMQGISERTVQRKWEKARLMLFHAVCG